MQYCGHKGKSCDMEDIEMTDGQKMNQSEEKGYTYLGIIQDSETKTRILQNKIRTELL